VVLWKQPQVDVQIMPLKGAFKRMIGGMSIFIDAGGRLRRDRVLPGLGRAGLPAQRPARHRDPGA